MAKKKKKKLKEEGAKEPSKQEEETGSLDNSQKYGGMNIKDLKKNLGCG